MVNEGSEEEMICFFNGESMQAANDDGNLGQEIQRILEQSPGLAGALTGISIRSCLISFPGRSRSTPRK